MEIIKYTTWSFVVVFFAFSIPLASFYLVSTVFTSVELPPVIYKTINQARVSSILKNIPVPTIHLIFVGDIMLDRGVKNSVLDNADGDFSFLFQNMNFIKEPDIAFGNLEGVISSVGEDSGKSYSFRFSPEVLDVLKNIGFDVLSVANNHSADWGSDAFEENIFRLENEKVLPVGGGINKKDASGVKIIDKDGIRIGFLGFSDVGPNWFSAKENKAGILVVDENYEYLVRKASRETDVLIVSLHFGEEYQNGSNNRQKDIARLAIDSGAKIVVGHHPHVIQEIETYKDGIIAYSLGNFIFDQNFSKETMEGLALEVYLEGDEIVATKQNKIKLNKYYQPELVD